MSHAMNLVGNAVAGKYTLQRVLGIGGMGAVYEAVHAYTGRRVALKVLGPDYASEPEAVERFLLEAQAPSSIGHPNIVEVLDAGEDPAVGVYVVLEYLDGEDLEAAVERGNLDIRTLLDVAEQLLAALEAAHARGFVHRDIKPANVYLTRNHDGSRRVKLLDFGIAKNVARGITVGNAVMGTPHYMAPEQAQGIPVDPRADLWAVGAVLYHALAGEPPFDGENPNVIMVRIIMGEAPSLGALRPDLSKALIALVDRALKKDVAARWPDARTMADALAKVPERHGAVLKISSTLRNRMGAASGMRAAASATQSPITLATEAAALQSAPVDRTLVVRPTPRTGTLDMADAPDVPSAPTPAPSAPPARSRRGLVAALVVVVAALASIAAATALRAPSAPASQSERRASVSVPDASSHVADASVSAPATVVAARLDVDSGSPPAVERPVEPEAPRAHGRRRRPVAGPSEGVAPEPAAPAQTRIGGITIPRYKP